VPARRDPQRTRLRVAVDAWNLLGDHRGIGRYVRAIVDSWLRCEAGRLEPTLVIPEWPAWIHAARYRAEIGNAGIAVCERRAATAQNFDAVWFPWNGMSWTTDAPSIATLHDASLFAMPAEDAAWAARERKPFEAAAAGARKILTDSAFSKSELARHLRIAPERIAVVPLGVDASPAPTGKLERFEGFDRYLLFVGEPERRKGLDTLTDAIALMPPPLRSGLGIVLAGKGTDEVPLGGFATPARGLGHVDDARLSALYAGAAAFIYPSRYEGFGLPVLEAMARGAPVIASDFPSIVEAGGDAAIYFPVGDAARLVASIETVLTDSAVCDGLRTRGLARAASMTWDTTAQRTIEEIETAIVKSR
jgi:glycosyltransferase involved in cell wall biosynthesis